LPGGTMEAAQAAADDAQGFVMRRIDAR